MSALPPHSAAPAEPSTPFTLPSRRQALWFWLRIRLLTAQRLAQDALSPHVRRWPAVPATQSPLAQASVIAELRSPLWSDGRSDEFALVAGKVHNLRQAIAAFDGVELPAGAMLSFWQQLSRISARKGFVLGREIREGCVVPTIGGGICQLSNALATAATRAGLTLVERHGHTARIEAAGVPSSQVDATVLWKHIDLRIATDRPLRLEVQMDASHLTLRLRAQAPTLIPQFPIRIHTRERLASQAPVVRSCVTCDETSCFRHQPDLAGLDSQLGSSAALLDGLTPELAQYLKQHPQLRDTLHLPQAVTTGQRQQVARHLAASDWTLSAETFPARIVALRRALWLRWNAKSQGRRQASVLDGQRWQARHALRQLPITATTLLVDQAYLPELWRSGQLAGRTFSVWMPALPMQAIIAQLDAAAQRWPNEPSLRDFRPDAALVQAESHALQQARQIITPHHAVAQWARSQISAEVTELEWTPKPATALDGQAQTAIKTIVFPASTLARKGWRELCAALAQLPQLPAQPLQLIVLGTVFDTQHLPPHVQLQRMGHSADWISQAQAVVLPAHVEHAPHALRRALACGLPVITTPACGLMPQAGLTLVQEGDIAALTQALIAL
ncbi:VanW family protein [Comamonas fluminis]|uniref:VanW family protein n=1 Tax=Comamonas fluminis TaxID=2796366 RepID=UPI001C47F61E|nr:VanW family protein [Comamonas fluminis]